MPRTSAPHCRHRVAVLTPPPRRMVATRPAQRGIWGLWAYPLNWGGTRMQPILRSMEEGTNMTLRNLMSSIIAIGTSAQLLLITPSFCQEQFPTEIVPQLSHSQYIETVEFSPNGEFVASGARDRTV